MSGQSDGQVLGHEDPGDGRRDTVEADRARQEREEHPARNRPSVYRQYVSDCCSLFWKKMEFE